jgi:hypothetical protein
MHLGPVTLTWIVGVLLSAVGALPLILFFERSEKNVSPEEDKTEE